MTVPVIALTGHLGAGKSTVLNHLLRRPGARIGVVMNDFGAINVDAGLVTGHVEEAAAITGGCVCCLPDAGGLDAALAQLSRPQLRLDAVIVETSGAADPPAVARLIRFSTAKSSRLGGLIDVVDAVEHHRTVDTAAESPARYAAATLVVLNKLDRIAPFKRDRTVAELTMRIRERNPGVPVVATMNGRLDPALVYDAAEDEDPPDQLPIAALLRSSHDGHEHAEAEAEAVTVEAPHPVDADHLIDLLEEVPTGAHRVKGLVVVQGVRGRTRYLVNVVGRFIDLSVAPESAAASRDGLVAIGFGLDTAVVRFRLERALQPAGAPTSTSGARRIARHQRVGR